MAAPTQLGISRLKKDTMFRQRAQQRFETTAKYVTDSIDAGTVPEGFRTQAAIVLAYAIDDGRFVDYSTAAWQKCADDSTIAVAAVDGDNPVAGVATGTVPSDAQLEAAVGAVWAAIATR
jgi:hypothetical protein